MRYHDFHLQGYAVSEGGLKVELHLVWPYPGPSQRDSRLEFTDVACYHFTHTSGTILTDITEEPLSDFVTSEHAFLSNAAELQGLRLWERDETQYLLRLQEGGYHAWRLESAVGFSGFIVAKTVQERNADSGLKSLWHN
ncbi:MAG TPA: hypothetical protein VGE29_22295 [Prosthecobacter sp.]